MSILSHSGKASTRLIMTGDSKDGKLFFNTNRMEQELGIKHELGFVDSLFMMHQLRRKNNTPIAMGTSFSIKA